MDKSNILYLQLFGEGGEGGDGAAAADAGSEGQAGVNVPDAGEARLRELGVPEDKLARRAQRMAKRPAPKQDQPVQQQDASAEEQTPEGNNQPAPSNRMTWDEIMQDPEYNQHMQATVQARLKSAKGAEETLGKLQPAIELMARRYGLDTNELDIDNLYRPSTMTIPTTKISRSRWVCRSRLRNVSIRTNARTHAVRPSNAKPPRKSLSETGLWA